MFSNQKVKKLNERIATTTRLWINSMNYVTKRLPLEMEDMPVLALGMTKPLVSSLMESEDLDPFEQPCINLDISYEPFETSKVASGVVFAAANSVILWYLTHKIDQLSTRQKTRLHEVMGKVQDLLEFDQAEEALTFVCDSVENWIIEDAGE